MSDEKVVLEPGRHWLMTNGVLVTREAEEGEAQFELRMRFIQAQISRREQSGLAILTALIRSFKEEVTDEALDELMDQAICAADNWMARIDKSQGST